MLAQTMLNNADLDLISNALEFYSANKELAPNLKDKVTMIQTRLRTHKNECEKLKKTVSGLTPIR